MARRRVVINRNGLNDALSSIGVRTELQRIADEVAARARASAPVESGAYRESIEAYIDTNWVRPRGKVIADVPYARTVEAATGNLARALGSE